MKYSEDIMRYFLDILTVTLKLSACHMAQMKANSEISKHILILRLGILGCGLCMKLQTLGWKSLKGKHISLKVFLLPMFQEYVQDLLLIKVNGMAPIMFLDHEPEYFYTQWKLLFISWFLLCNSLLSIWVCHFLFTTIVLSYNNYLTVENPLNCLLQHGGSFWFWGHVFIGKWHGWTKSSNKCSHFWTFLCTCSRWTFPGRHEGKANASLHSFYSPLLLCTSIWSVRTMIARLSIFW